MDPLTYDILKSPHYIGSANQMKPYFRPMPKLTISQVNRVDRTCRLCMGVNFGNGTIVNQHSNGLMSYERCPACKGTRIMPNVEERR